jgi:glycosyltransferase involved in cell wall biosynthesis
VRILHVIQELRTGGAERVVASLARGADASGHAVAIAAAPGPLAEGLPVEIFPLGLLQRRPWRVPRNAWALRTVTHSWRPDVVHAHNPGMAAVTALATRRGRNPRGLVSVHGVPESDWPATARILRLAGLPAVACGPGVEAALADRSCRVLATISNGVGPAPDPADRAALEREWGLTPGTRLIVAAGRLVSAKNHALAIRALADVPDAALAILGEGPLRDDLEDAARAAGVADRVVLAGLRADAREVMGAADAVVICSHAEGLPLVALEALAAGTPLVATAVRGLRDLIADGRDGMLVPPDEPDALAGALRRVLADRDLARRLGAEGQRVAAANSEEVMVASYLALYERIEAS